MLGEKGQKSVGGLCHLLVQGGVRRRGEHAELLCPPLRVTVRLAGVHGECRGRTGTQPALATIITIMLQPFHESWLSAQLPSSQKEILDFHFMCFVLLT